MEDSYLSIQWNNANDVHIGNYYIIRYITSDCQLQLQAKWN